MNRYSSRKQFGYIKYIKHLKSEHLSIQNQLTVHLNYQCHYCFQTYSKLNIIKHMLFNHQYATFHMY